MSRTKLSKSGVQQAVEMKRNGYMDKDIAASLCVRPETFSRWLNNPKTKLQSQLCQAIKESEAEYKASLLNMIYEKAEKGTWQAAAWLLERKYPDEYGARQGVKAEQEVNTHVDVSKESDDELFRELQAAAGRMVAVEIARQN